MRIWTRDNMNWIEAKDNYEVGDIVLWAGVRYKIITGPSCVPTTEREKREKQKAIAQPVHKKVGKLPAAQPVSNGRRSKSKPPAARGKRARSI